MLKTSWTMKVTNEEVLVCASETSSILKMIRQRKHKWLGHILRYEGFLHDIIEGKMTGKPTRVRKSLKQLGKREDEGKVSRH